MMLVAIVIPTINERENIERLIPRTIEVLAYHNLNGHILIVDDESSDGTSEVAEQLDGGVGHLFVMRRIGKRGLGSAYKDGFRLALDKGYEGAVEMDADLSHDPSYLPSFYKKLSEGYDLVLGSRYVSGGSIPAWTFYRRLISKSMNFFVRLLLGLKPRDCTTGFRAYSAKALKAIDLDGVTSDGYAFQVEMTLKCQQKCLNICEIPIAFIDRQLGKSKLNAKEKWNFLISILRLAFS